MMYLFDCFYDFVHNQNCGYHKIGLRKSEMIINFMRNKSCFRKVFIILYVKFTKSINVEKMWIDSLTNILLICK